MCRTNQHILFALGVAAETLPLPSQIVETDTSILST